MQISRRHVHGAENIGRQGACNSGYACRLANVANQDFMTRTRIMRELQLYPVAASPIFMRNPPPCYPIPCTCACDVNLTAVRMAPAELPISRPFAESDLLAAVAHDLRM